MFGNRKRKPAEDDDPLVPHGLIWHATAQENSGPTLVPKADPVRPAKVAPAPAQHAKPPQATKAPFGDAVQYAQVLEIARRARLAQPKVSAENPEQEPTPAASPLPWWRTLRPESQATQSVPLKLTLPRTTSLSGESKSAAPIAPIEPQAAPASNTPALINTPRPIQPIKTTAKVAPVSSASVGQVTPIGRPVYKSAIPDDKSPIRENRQQFALFSSVSAFCLGFGRELSRKFSSVRESLRTVCTRLLLLLDTRTKDVRAKFVRAGKYGREVADSGARQLRDLGHASIGRMKSARFSLVRAPNLSRPTTAVAAEAKQQDLAITQAKTSAFPRFRLRLTGFPFKTKILFTQQFLTWRLKPVVPRDNQLWRSMTMAAITALIALAIVSLVPRYAAKSLPSRILSGIKTTKNTVPAANIVVLPAVKKNANAKKAKAIGYKRPTLANKTAARPKPVRRNNRDDDYVAPDTYKYYGTSSQASR